MTSVRDKWLGDYDTCAQLGQDIMEKITARNRNPKGSTAYSKALDPLDEDCVHLLVDSEPPDRDIQSAHIRTSMHQFSARLNDLRQNLMSTGMRYSVTQRELERRQGQLDQLSTKEKQLDQAFKNNGRAEYGNRTSLLDIGPRSVNSDAPGVGWSTEGATEERTDMSFDDIKQEQQHIMREQDQGLDVLSEVLGRQKQMAVDIGNEVDGQNELIDDIGDQVCRTDQRLLSETRHVKIVDRKSNTCGYWVFAILIFIAIIVIAVVPYGGKA